MKLSVETAELFVPDGTLPHEALARTTHMGIGAHPDDLEILAWDGIAQCFGRRDAWFSGIVVTDGGGSPRTGPYAAYTDAQMRAVRREEQKRAAGIGRYAAVALLDYPSSAVKDASNAGPVDDIAQLLAAAQPDTVYTHNPADKHDTHVAVALRTIAAIRRLDSAQRPRRLLGCEVWRDLDWMVDADKVALDCSTREDLQRALVGVFASQIVGGKRYDLATMARRRANATYHESHDADAATGLIFAMDLTPLIEDDTRAIAAYVQAFVERFAEDVADRLTRLA
jgi:LmbE family N-acetylglucosaminyl deacetylase